MEEFQERRYFRAIIFSRPFFLLLLAVAFFFSFSALKVYRQSREAVSRNRVVEKELDELKQRRNELNASIQELETPEGAEKELREKFQIKKPGEEMVIIVDEAPPAASNGPEEESFFRKILNFIKKII